MSKNKIQTGGGFVFSTNPEFDLSNNNEDSTVTLPPSQQVLRLWLERVKGGKEATVIKGFVGTENDLSELARTLKNKCATGGNAKDGDIILQGNHRDKVIILLAGLGYKNVKKAGG